MYISVNVRGTSKFVKKGLAEANRWSGNGRVKHFTKQQISFHFLPGTLTVATRVPTTPLDVLSQDNRATEHWCAIHMWQRSTTEIHLPTGLSRHPKETLISFSAEDGATTERRRRFQSQPVGFFRDVALEGLTRGQGRSRLAHPLTEKSKSVWNLRRREQFGIG